MNKEVQLFEFLCEYIDIQIKKYVLLTKIGVGPDAGMNASLVKDQVGELMQFAGRLLDALEARSPGSALDEKGFRKLLDQTHFYLTQEHLRGYAGWLIDDNKIHSPELERLTLQHKQIHALASSSQIELNSREPFTETQEQCMHDSHAIAFYILDVAIKLKAAPSMELDEKIPKHARTVLRGHASGSGSRYFREDIWNSIVDLHEKCEGFLKRSNRQKSSVLLSKESAIESAEHDRVLLNELMEGFRKVHPESALFSSDPAWQEIFPLARPRKPDIKKPSSNADYYCRLFGGVAASVAAAAICAFIYLANDQDREGQFFSRFSGP